jgi:uncharacterized phage protein (TIGR01671 family)
MREIKFRAFDIIGKKWVYGDLVHNHKVTQTGVTPRVMVGGYEVDPETVGQFTGLHDKNGKEIYEGDIVEMMRTPEKRRKCVSVRHIVKAVSVISWTFKSLTKEVLSYCMDGFTDWHSFKFEVVGNIHDNPDMVQE